MNTVGLKQIQASHFISMKLGVSDKLFPQIVIYTKSQFVTTSHQAQIGYDC